MKNPYAAGFYALLAAFTILCACLFWSIWTNGKAGSTQDAFAFISSMSSLAQAFTAAVLAVLAFKGLTSWKRELIHGKAIAVVWDASLAFSNVEASVIRLCNRWSESAPVTRPEIVIQELRQDPVAAQLEAFDAQCLILDKVVEKKGHVWRLRATELHDLIDRLAVEVHKASYDTNRGLVGLMNSRNAKNLDSDTDRLVVLLNVIQDDLQRLDSKYSG